MIDVVGAVGEGILTILFLATGAWLAWQARRASTRGVHALSLAAAAVCAISAFAALQRLGSEAVQASWLPPSVADFLWGPWEALQVVVSVTVALWGVKVLARFWVPLGRAERMVKVLTGRLPDEVDIRAANFSPRERQVLQLMGEGHLSDDELARLLFIAPSTAATHVQRLLRKTGLHSRTDLILAANRDAPLFRGRSADRQLPRTVRLRRWGTELLGRQRMIKQTADGGPPRRRRH